MLKEMKNKLDNAVLKAIESGKIRFEDEDNSIKSYIVTDTLSLQRVYNSSSPTLLAEKQRSTHWVLVKETPSFGTSNYDSFVLGHRVMRALDKLRDSQLKRIEEEKDSKNTAAYKEIIDEIEGLQIEEMKNEE